MDSDFIKKVIVVFIMAVALMWVWDNYFAIYDTTPQSLIDINDF